MQQGSKLIEIRGRDQGKKVAANVVAEALLLVHGITPEEHKKISRLVPVFQQQKKPIDFYDELNLSLLIKEKKLLVVSKEILSKD